MPVCVLIDCGAVLLGGLLGGRIGGRIREDLKSTLSLTFGFCAISIGVVNIVHTQTLPALVLSVILGTMAGTLMRLDSGIQRALTPICCGVFRLERGSAAQNQLMAVIVLFCASGTGIFGAIQYGATGDGSILFAKTFLGFFSALIFSSVQGTVVSAISIPQCLILTGLYLCGPLVLRLSPSVALEDFTACGGVVMLVTGFHMTGIKSFPLMNMIPALLLVIPISAIWNQLL